MTTARARDGGVLLDSRGSTNDTPTVRARRFILECLSWPCLAAASVVLLAWLTGRIVSDRFVWSQWLLWIPAPLAILAGALGALVSLRPATRPAIRRRRLALWVLVTIAVAGSFLFVEHRFLRAAPDQPRGLRLIHWNMLSNTYGPIDAYARSLIELDGQVTILSNASAALWQEPVREWMGQQIQSFRVEPFTILSRYPLLEARPVMAADGISIAMARIDTTEALGRPLAILMVDLPSDPTRSRTAIAARVRRVLADPDLPPLDLVVGDFNMTRGSASIRAMFPAFRHAYDDAGHGYGATFRRGDWPLYHIDHVLVAQGWRANRYDVIDPHVGWHAAQRVWIERDEP